jgi:hypothetical protein
MIKNQWPKVKADLDGGRLSPIGLIRHKSANPIDILNNHQVLAWGYDLNGDDLILHVYDPNDPAEDITLTLNIGRPENTTRITYTSTHNTAPVFMFFRTEYTFVDPSSISPRRPATETTSLFMLTLMMPG